MEPAASEPARQPGVVLLSGGTACRNINMALCRRGVAITRVVPAWDSGGSSKAIRERLGILPVGDIRQAMMTMAHGEGRSGAVVKICNARLSQSLDPAELRAEFAYYADGRHPLLHRLDAVVCDEMLRYLNIFGERAGAEFDLRNGSVGNFILTGAYLAHGHDINAAITAFRQLCHITGNIWPAATDNHVQLAATMNDGGEILGQHLITQLTPAESAVGIADVELRWNGTAGDHAANGAALRALAEADVIVFGPGSFYTSILPHVMMPGVAEAIAANVAARKVFISNILEDRETQGITIEQMVRTLLAHFSVNGRNAGSFVTHVMSNRELFPFRKTVGAFAYLKIGQLERLCDASGIELITGEYEDAWRRGEHDGDAVSDRLLLVALGSPQ